MSAQEREAEKKFFRECIEVYREHPVLWNIKSEDYSNRRMKEEAYGVLVNKFKEKYPTWGREEVKKKINSFRTNFRKEFKKVLDSEKSGAGSEEIYEPTLWYYDDLLFLIDQKKPSESRSSIQSAQNSDTLPESVEDILDNQEVNNNYTFINYSMYLQYSVQYMHTVVYNKKYQLLLSWPKYWPQQSN